MSDQDLYLNPDQVCELLNQVGQQDPDEVIVVRCVRKGPASKPGGPDEGDLYDLHCTKKPPYTPKTNQNRKADDTANEVLTVFVSNRRNRQTGDLGDWRRVNIAQVQKVILFDGTEYEVTKA